MITLSPNMKVNVGLVDEQHEELVNRINAVVKMGLRSVSKEESRRTLDLLEDYIHKHFADEERLQAECGYPKLEWHKGQHQFYVGEFNKLKAEFETNGHSVEFALKLNKSIIDWIVKHIKYIDVEFGRYYNEHVGKSW